MSPVLRSSAMAAAVVAFTAAAGTASLHAQEKAVLTAPAAASQQVRFDVFLPLQHKDQLDQLLLDQQNPSSGSYRQWLTPESFNSRFGPTAGQLAEVEAQLTSFGLNFSVVSSRHLSVSGAAADIERAFNTVLKNGRFPGGGSTVAAVAPLVRSGAMLRNNAFVTGLSGAIYMKPHGQKIDLPQNRYTEKGAYWFDDLKQAYKFPSYQYYAGSGTNIGILMTGDFNPSDMNLYFGHEKLATPSFKTVQVLGGAPYDPNGSFETHLDLQQSGGMAPLAKITLFNIPDLSDYSIVTGLDTILTQNKMDVVSMSFGGAELFYTAAYNGGTDYTYLLQLEDEYYAQGNAQGISFVASSGDAGAVPAFPPACFNFGPNCGHVLPSAEFPASSPHVTGVGGTNLVTRHSATTLDSTYIREQAYADPLAYDIFYGTSATGSYWGSGGGLSILFDKPAYQVASKVEGKTRSVPDVSLHMGGCPGGAISCSPDDSADLEVIGGYLTGVIGTSASAPDFAGLMALTVERLGGRVGNANPYIYSLYRAQNAGLISGVYYENIDGYNGYYGTKPGYDRVLGVGTVNGAAFMLAPSVPLAGIPQTISNP